MRVLTRYLLRQHLYYMAVCLAAGVLVYVLSDLFDRLDAFVEEGVGGGVVLWYYAAKIPLMVSQLMPAVFLVATVVLVSVMAKSRELMALMAGGVSGLALARFVVVYGLVMSCAQLGFSQYLGVMGDREARRTWQEDVRGKDLDRTRLGDVWFTEGPFVVHLETTRPLLGVGAGVSIYQMADDGLAMERIIEAASFKKESATHWRLMDVKVLDPKSFNVLERATLTLPIRQDLSHFMAFKSSAELARLPLWELSTVIEDLRASGSNVESLATAWHAKVAYAASLLVMGLVGLGLTSLSSNPSVNVTASLVATFVYYAVFVTAVTAGEKGFMAPWTAAWLGNIVFLALAGSRLYLARGLRAA